MTALRSGIHPLDEARWARVLADPSPAVRAAAATHGWSTPPAVWAELAYDPDDRVRKAAVTSRFTSPVLLRRMTGDRTAAIADIAQARVTTPASE